MFDIWFYKMYPLPLVFFVWILICTDTKERRSINVQRLPQNIWAEQWRPLFFLLQMGTLYLRGGHTTTYNSLKCLVTASFCQKNLGLRSSSEATTEHVIMKFEPFEKEDRCLTDPFAIMWYLSTDEDIFGGRSNATTTAEILQGLFDFTP